jgi:hypothetical protein
MGRPWRAAALATRIERHRHRRSLAMPKKPLDPLRPTDVSRVEKLSSLQTSSVKMVSVTLPSTTLPALAALKTGLTTRGDGDRLVLDDRKVERLIRLLVADTDLQADAVAEALREASSILGIDLENDPRFLGL